MPLDTIATSRDDADGFASLRALAVANARYWSQVAPITRSELKRWRAPAEHIVDGQLRMLALEKLSGERFNAEVATTLATLPPRAMRADAVRAIVALEVLFDYLDGRTELPSDDPLGEGLRLFDALTSAIEPAGSGRPSAAGTTTKRHDEPDGAYMEMLSTQVRESLYSLPAAGQVSPVAQRSVERCAQAQSRLHAAARLGDGPLREWAESLAPATGLGWREYVGGSASSVLCAHALIAAAGDPATTAAGAAKLDAAYLAIGGVITMLDSLVDHSADSARGEAGFIRLFEASELEQTGRALVEEALARAREAPHSAHHVMTLAGAVAYYATHSGARDRHARPVFSMLRRELSPTVWPGLLVLGGWRMAKLMRARLSGSDHALRQRPDR